MKKVAIFDIDGTIFRSSLLIEVTDALIQEGLFPKKVQRVYAKSYRDWVTRKDSYEIYISDVVKVFEKHIKGVRHKDFVRIANNVVAEHKEKVYRYTRQLVKDLKKKQYFLLAISHSPKELVDAFCYHWGFDKVYGRIYEVDNKGTFTGKTLYKDEINNKANIVTRAMEKEHLTLVNSVGVGDSAGDIPLLGMVAHPICFNPNSVLYNHAKKAGWSIVVERKDVVYKI